MSLDKEQTLAVEMIKKPLMLMLFALYLSYVHNLGNTLGNDPDKQLKIKVNCPNSPFNTDTERL